MSALPAWVERAQQTPLMFSQVREDALQDLAVVRRLQETGSQEVRVFMVASGGCTAAALAAEPGISEIHLVDPNPSQLALAQLKLRLLQTADPDERLPLLGHAPQDESQRRQALKEHLTALMLSNEALGPPDEIARLGPDQAGRYEQTFAALRAGLREQEAELEALLSGVDPSAQAALVAPGAPLGDALARAFAEVFALPNLVALFGEGATANPVRPFDEHFLQRTRAVCASLPAAQNPYLWQVLRGRFPPHASSPWLMLPRAKRLTRVRIQQAFMNDALAESQEHYHLVHLSNILDWLTPAQAHETLALARERLEPGGVVVVRQLNSTLDVRAAGVGFHWEGTWADKLHAADRSYFYRRLHLGYRD